MRLSVCRGDFAIRIRDRFVWRAGFPGRASSGPCRRFAGSFGRAAVRAVSRGASSRPGSGGSGGRPVAGRAFAPLVSVAVGTEVAAPLPHSCRDSVGVSSCFCRMLAGILPGFLRGACRRSAGDLSDFCRVPAGFRILPERFRTAAAACGTGPERASPCGRWLRPERIGSAADRRGARRHGSGVFAGPDAAPVPPGDCRGGQTTAKKRTFRGAERRFVRSALRVADIFSIFACYCA